MRSDYLFLTPVFIGVFRPFSKVRKMCYNDVVPSGQVKCGASTAKGQEKGQENE
jgi:hypothetical protein